MPGTIALEGVKRIEKDLSPICFNVVKQGLAVQPLQPAEECSRRDLFDHRSSRSNTGNLSFICAILHAERAELRLIDLALTALLPRCRLGLIRIADPELEQGKQLLCPHRHPIKIKDH
jgi:hypothetical protein